MKQYQFMLAQGILMGSSVAFLQFPAFAIVAQYFDKRRAAALGIMASGSSIGGVLFPIILSKLLNGTDVGFGWYVFHHLLYQCDQGIVTDCHQQVHAHHRLPHPPLHALRMPHNSTTRPTSQNNHFPAVGFLRSQILSAHRSIIFHDDGHVGTGVLHPNIRCESRDECDARILSACYHQCD